MHHGTWLSRTMELLFIYCVPLWGHWALIYMAGCNTHPSIKPFHIWFHFSVCHRNAHVHTLQQYTCAARCHGDQACFVSAQRITAQSRSLCCSLWMSAHTVGGHRHAHTPLHSLISFCWFIYQVFSNHNCPTLSSFCHSNDSLTDTVQKMHL